MQILAFSLVVVIAFLVSFVSQRFLLQLSRCFQIFEHFDDGIHNHLYRPNLGGVGIIVGMVAGITALLLLVWLRDELVFLDFFRISPFRVVLFVLSLFLTGLLGFLDDKNELGAAQKLFAGALLAAVIVWCGFRIEAVSLPFGEGVVQLGAFTYPLTLFWILAVANAFNLIDGLDGLASGVMSVAALFLIIIALMRGMILPALVIAAFLGALVGFIPWNRYPSKVLMGDTGSLFAGALLAGLSIKIIQNESGEIGLQVLIFLFAIPLLDILLAFMRRILKGKNPFIGDYDHIHHRLIRRGWKEPNAVTILIVLSTAFALLALLIPRSRGFLGYAWVILGLGLLLWLITYLGYIRLIKK